MPRKFSASSSTLTDSLSGVRRRVLDILVEYSACPLAWLRDLVSFVFFSRRERILLEGGSYPTCPSKVSLVHLAQRTIRCTLTVRLKFVYYRVIVSSTTVNV